ncbi:MAG TPA: peptidylprolyl isomerase [Acetobacteraceae bacterium]|jgi:peptidyl-prolyl cis-trans isomerase C
MPNWLQPIGRSLCRLTIIGVLAALAALPAAAADKDPANTPRPATPSATQPLPEAEDLPLGRADTDPVVASVEGHPIYLSDLGRAERALPANLRSVPFNTLYPVLLDRMVDHESLVMMARRQGLEDNPIIKKDIEDATERVLEAAILALDAAPKVTEAAIKARYDQLYADRPATEEVHARHILVSSKEEADKVIAQLKAGADFATLARQVSEDPDAKTGGDLGFFRREQVWPGFADVAFSLQPGQVADQPIHNEFGWHVIKVIERRLVAPPGYSEVHDKLREELMQDAVREVVAKARSDLTIHKWNLDGTPMDGGTRLGGPPAAAAK